MSGKECTRVFQAVFLLDVYATANLSANHVMSGCYRPPICPCGRPVGFQKLIYLTQQIIENSRETHSIPVSMRWGSKLTFRAILIFSFSSDSGRVRASAVDQSTRVHALACSDLRSTPTIGSFSYHLREEGNNKKGWVRR